ncbi:MAG: class I SAM-dependent methyltransferase [Saprospiraceae bacterium]|nr:class I SAM-dependent methyltransferase [Candidatus Vicinibacter affinis]
MDYQTNGKSFETNRQLWEKRTHVHIGSAFYETEGIVADKSSLTEIEESLLPDLEGRDFTSAVSFWIDTISLARRGAICTGLDFSKEAIRNAKELSEKAGVAIDFVEANVLIR